MARQHALDVTGVDLDPAMIARAQANTDRLGNGHGRRPAFLVGDVASLAFPDASFDLVVSSLSMHHWADPTAGLGEIIRVLRPNGPGLGGLRSYNGLSSFTPTGYPHLRAIPAGRSTPRRAPRASVPREPASEAGGRVGG
jgi:ubiquinone/menaquinone biosynthesis C-methylase UbiE